MLSTALYLLYRFCLAAALQDWKKNYKKLHDKKKGKKYYRDREGNIKTFRFMKESTEKSTTNWMKKVGRRDEKLCI